MVRKGLIYLLLIIIIIALQIVLINFIYFFPLQPKGYFIHRRLQLNILYLNFIRYKIGRNYKFLNYLNIRNFFGVTVKVTKKLFCFRISKYGIHTFLNPLIKIFSSIIVREQGNIYEFFFIHLVTVIYNKSQIR